MRAAEPHAALLLCAALGAAAGDGGQEQQGGLPPTLQPVQVIRHTLQVTIILLLFKILHVI